MELDHEGLGILGLERQGLSALLWAAELIQQLVILPAASQNRLAQLHMSQCCEDHGSQAFVLLTNPSISTTAWDSEKAAKVDLHGHTMGSPANKTKHPLSSMSQAAAARSGHVSAQPV